ncbi:hypothetical protein [Lentzea cavernae]|uniref:DUF320 domain-containing protein n=1 Tax=Lentzea cavernae TaxID=2020703 RepID=A0ABQ3MKX0_9PSEU|nr:hypothetical protein [Lentzea cavernae]GHH48717.1 hypothetical protein GCM10017774_54970 [Lentzea cavernae]
MNIKKIVASAGLAAGALAALVGTASASPLPALPQVDPIGKVSDVAGSAGVSTLHDSGGNVDVVRDGTKVLGG